MAQELKKFWNRFILQQIKTLFLVMCLPWYLVAYAWVRPSVFNYFAPASDWLSTSFLTLFLGCSGTPALTSRGFLEEDFAKVAEYFDAAVKLALKIKAAAKGLLYHHLVDINFISVCNAWSQISLP